MKNWFADRFLSFSSRIENSAYPYINQNPAFRPFWIRKGWIHGFLHSPILIVPETNVNKLLAYPGGLIRFDNIGCFKRDIYILPFPILCYAYVYISFHGSLASFLFGGLGWFFFVEKNTHEKGFMGFELFWVWLHPFFHINKWLFKS